MLELLVVYIGPVVIFGLLIFALVRGSGMIRYIDNDEYGVVEKLWSTSGSVRGGLISLDGRAGYQPDTLRGGYHFFPPFVYRVHRQKLITVRSMAYVFSRIGAPLPVGQTLARTPENVTFDDVRNFLANGGQCGPQRLLVRQGTFAINTVAFIVISDDTTYAIDLGNDEKDLKTLRDMIEEREGFNPVIITKDMIGAVTVHDGPALDPDDIIAPVVGTDPKDEITFHNSFQYPESFLQAGGRRGRQEQVLVEGTFYINRLFATVEIMSKTSVEIGTVGVVISYTGRVGADVSGTDYRHGQLVERNSKGVWAETLGPRKYALNPYAYRVKMVPTTNFVLRWVTGRIESHGFDSGLTEIEVITKDAYQPVLPLSVVVHIAPERAPRVIQQFADIKLLVEQTLDPMVSAFFKDVAQSRKLIELIQSRAELQAEAKREMSGRFLAYNLELLEVMIGTPRAKPDDKAIGIVLDQLRLRQLAVEQMATYTTQQEAAEKERDLNQSRAVAALQAELTKSKISIEVAKNQGEAQLRLREQEAAGIKVTAEANAQQTVMVGDAEASRIRAVGLATAAATKAQVAAFEGEGADYQFRRGIAEQFADAIKHAQVVIVPDIMMAGVDGNSGGGNMVNAMLAMMMHERRQPPPRPSNGGIIENA